MGRGKVELKRIEDKSSRQVSFTKRRNGLMKKAHELAVMCDIDVALFVFSGKNKLYEYSSGESMIKILNHYQSYKNADEAVRRTVRQTLALENSDARTVDELTQMIQRQLEKVQQSDVPKLCHLETEIESALQKVRIKKNQLMLGAVKVLKDKILNHYQSYKNADEAVRRTVRQTLALENSDARTVDELTQMIQRQLEKVQQSDVPKLCHLETEIESALQKVRIKKNQLMLGAVKVLKDKQNELREEKRLMEHEIIATRLNEGNVEG